jgi:hypothetical protein
MTSGQPTYGHGGNARFDEEVIRMTDQPPRQIAHHYARLDPDSPDLEADIVAFLEAILGRRLELGDAPPT